MRPGPLIRSLLGPYERRAAELYRRLFIDLDDFAARLRQWAPEPRRILEVGCGEGAMTERLVRAFPAATITAIDIVPTVGRLFDGPAERVTFLQQPVERVADSDPGSFDLAVLCDVLHHVPLSARRGLLGAIRRAMAPGGMLAFKDWVPSHHPIHALCMFADRYITGDDVHFCSRPDIEGLLREVFGADSIGAEATVRPWTNNLALLVRP